MANKITYEVIKYDSKADFRQVSGETLIDSVDQKTACTIAVIASDYTNVIKVQSSDREWIKIFTAYN